MTTTLDNLQKSAKRWLKALRIHDADARRRLALAYPAAPEEPGLRDVQHALAREHGYESWKALRDAVEGQLPRPDALASEAGGRTHHERVATFLEFACWDHHTHGKGDHRMCDRAAQRILAAHPEVAHESLFTAVVSGALGEVERILTEHPEAARSSGGARGWTPILYSAFTRFSHPATIQNGVAIARALLDRGANPNDFYMAGDAKYSVLTGIAGEGEQDSPRQPYATEMFRLPSARSRDGRTAMDWALKRGMTAVAAKIAVEHIEDASVRRLEVDRFEKLAKDVLIAHQSGDPAALGSVQDHFGHAITWDQLRAALLHRHAEILGRDPGTSFLNLHDVQQIVARHKGYADWEALLAAVNGGRWVS